MLVFTEYNLSMCLKCKSARRLFQPGEGPSPVGAFSVILKTNGSFAALVILSHLHQWQLTWPRRQRQPSLVRKTRGWEAVRTSHTSSGDGDRGALNTLNGFKY